ncbi:MAG: CGNR zinc finger domain-containing protein, partial [Chloroflexota bacterium]|nr:CGNR zinc finger domain-containing protein [Chloroflexota bacterium]
MGWPPRFIFISGRLAIDFAQTGGEGGRARWERWHTVDDLAEWAQACPQLRITPAVTPRELADARALREAIWASAQSLLRGAPLPPDAAGVLCRTAAPPSLVPALYDGTMGWAPGATGEQVLSSVARDAIELFGTALNARLRECQNSACALLFVDQSRPGKRAWCTMRRCGNLSKVARYRAAHTP